MSNADEMTADTVRRIPAWLHVLLVTGAMCLFVSLDVASQDDAPASDQPPSAPSSSPIQLSGEAGAFGEVYDISGAEKRRPSSTGRLYLRSTLSAWGSVSASLNLMLSTEGSSSRQDINRMDFNPRWRWGSAHLGDFVEELTPLTLSGVRIRGGAVMFSPSTWRLSLISGLTTRAVSSQSGSRAYERSITGVRVGFGKNDGTSVDLFVLNARDRLSSLANLPEDTLVPDTSAIDTTGPDLEQNPVTVTPQENLVVSMASRLALFDRKITWRNEVGASAITRDRRSAELDNSDVPDFLQNLFTPRKSSGADFAYSSDLSLTLKRLAVNTGFHYVGPGYVSLGVSSLMSDKREITAGVSYRFQGGMVRLDGSLQQDNLIDQKSFTTDRTRLNSLVSYRLLPNWNATVGATFMQMENDSQSDTTRLDYGNWIVRTSQQITFRRRQGLKGISLDLVYQNASDNNPLRKAASVDYMSGTLSTSLGISSSLEVVPSAGLITSRSGEGGRTFTQSYVVSARHVGFQRRLSTNAAFTVTVTEITTILRPNIRSSFGFAKNLTVSAEVEATSVKGGAVALRFDEIAGRLILSRRF